MKSMNNKTEPDRLPADKMAKIIITIEDVEDISDFIGHLGRLRDQVVECTAKKGLNYNSPLWSDADAAGLSAFESDLSDANCYGSHDVEIINED
jgi:hypothetical protein